jgi:TonB-dependent starch-binding outer membrane protein SusC
VGTILCRSLDPQPRRQGLRSRLVLLLSLLAAGLIGAPALSAQETGTIAGRVTDATTAQPLASAQVTIADLQIGVLTQQNGRFILLNVPAGTHTVTVQRIGYRDGTAAVTVVAGQSVAQDFTIEEEALALDEIIVTGTPGGTQRRAIGNSVARVDAAAISEQAVVTNVQEMLAGRTPGLRFGRVDGQVGGGSGITIRGVASVELGSQPLIYIDGVRVDNSAERGPDTGSASGNSSALGDLNPEEIESIEVIKGPSAATLYGTEASAGVIQIITKRGGVGAPEFTFEVGQGTNFMVDPAGTLGTQYVCAIVATQCPEDQLLTFNMYEEANDYLRHQGRYAGLDLPYEARDEDLFGYGYSQRYNLSAQGGSEQVRYYLSGGWEDETGIVDYNTNTAANIRANVTVLMTDNLNLDVSTAYGQGMTRYATIDGEGGVWHQLVWAKGGTLPGIPGRADSGTGFLGFQERWPQDIEKADITREFSRFTGSATATHNPYEWLTQRLTFGIDRGWDTNTEFLPMGANIPESPAGALNYARPLTQNVTFDYAASLIWRATEAIGTTTSFGAQYYSRFEEELLNYGKGFITPSQRVIDQTEFGDRTIDFTSIENKSLGFYVQEELSYQDRLFLTGAVRADDNSAFGSEFDLQYYPKLSASWVISEEPFWNFDLVNSLRLRTAWGQSGRQPDTFASQTLYGPMLGPNGNGLIPTNIGNPEVGPEVSTELEAGFDVALLDQRLSGEFSYYRTKTEDLLVDQALAPTTGLTLDRQANLGSMENQGWEVSLNARVVEQSNFAFDLAVAADHTTNEITSLGEEITPSGNFQLGWPYPNVSSDYIIRDAELDENGSVIRESVMCDGGVPAVPGGPPINQGGETIPCSEYQQEGILLGPAYPTYTFRVSPTFTILNNLQLYALAEGNYGRWIASTDAEYACRFYFSCKANVVKTDANFVAGNTTFQYDDRYRGRFPADFWKLRQVGMRYNLPQSLVSRTGADRASLSLTANNIWTFWQKTETDLAGNAIYDPEYTINGDSPQQTALWEMPGIASFNAAIRITF